MIPEPNFPAKPDHFIGRKPHIEAFRLALQQGLATGRMTSLAVLGDWGIGKSSLMLKLADICSEPNHGMLPVLFSVSKELENYLHFAESLLDKLGDTLARSSSVTDQLRAEAQRWKLRRLNIGGLGLEREGPSYFLSSGSALLRHALGDAWERFLRPAHLNGAIIFLDDLHNLSTPVAEDIALELRDQFQSLGIEGLNYSVCFSARTDYFADIRSFAEPAVRFYDKLYLTPFTPEEITEYTDAVFGMHHEKSHRLSQWLYEKTLGHPYFLAFICRQLSIHAQGFPPESPGRLWPSIFARLERQKFRSDLAQVADKELEVLHAFARAEGEEFTPSQLGRKFDRVYFRRLTEKGLLIRTARGRYKLYHPLFRLFLKETKP